MRLSKCLCAISKYNSKHADNCLLVAQAKKMKERYEQLTNGEPVKTLDDVMILMSMLPFTAQDKT